MPRRSNLNLPDERAPRPERKGDKVVRLQRQALVDQLRKFAALIPDGETLVFKRPVYSYYAVDSRVLYANDPEQGHHEWPLAQLTGSGFKAPALHSLLQNITTGLRLTYGIVPAEI